MSGESNKEEDFLEVDREIPGQKYTCISFVSPEETLRNKDVYFVHKFLKTIAKNYDLDENTIEDKFKDFMYVNNDKLEKEFYENNDFRTTVRGVKVRGTYDTLREAQVRAKVLQKRDPNFNVYIGQVGYWLPWDPNPHKIDTQEYAEGELNTLVKKYKENQSKKDAHFQENIDYVKEQAAKKVAKQKEENSKNKTLTDTENVERVDTTETVVNSSNFTDEDPWMKNKKKENDN